MPNASWKDSVVRIRVDVGNGHVGWGTGFFIAPQLVMTALHVVSPGNKHGVPWNGRSCAAFVEMEIPSSPGVRATEAEATLAWPTLGIDHKIDVAVLRLKSASRSEFLPLGTTWANHTGYEAYGFPRHLDLNSISIEGKTGINRDGLADIADREAAPDESGDWAGVSGSPVRVDGAVVGIIVRRVEGARQFLRAVPIELVRGTAGFAEIPGLDLSPSTASLEEEIRRTFEHHPNAVAAVTSARKKHRTDIASVHEWLARSALSITVPVLRESHRRIVQDVANSTEKRAMIAAAKAIESTLITLGRDKLNVAAKDNDDGSIVCVADQWATIELYLANRHKRGVYFRPLGDINEGLVGRDDLAEPPFTGRNTRKSVEAIRKDLIERLQPQGAQTDPALNRLLRSRADPNRGVDGQYFYVAFDGGDGASGRDMTIEAIRKQFSNLPVVVRRDVGDVEHTAEFSEQDLVTAIGDTIYYQNQLEERFRKDV